MGLDGIIRAAMGAAFVLTAWQFNAHNQNYDPSHLTLENVVSITRQKEKGEAGSGFDYAANYAIMFYGAYQLARGVSRMKL
ncbi:hypothetical protein HYV82_00610 [Candidatus Woesearchaeota archaeon]|nr:hypothetical protein [Candidatus Woesearchaeota archaeon]MBI2574367.1 hypothetical protein [Candidatus Woesearchaeota archaeon]